MPTTIVCGSDGNPFPSRSGSGLLTSSAHPSYCGLESSSVEVRDRAPQFAVVPVGAHEQHGAHLPLATDSIIASWAGDLVARRLGGLLMPTIPFGTSFTHRTFTGTATLDWTTLGAVVSDVLLACFGQGITIAFVMSGHGGNFILNPCVRGFNARHPAWQAVLVPEHVFFGAAMSGDDLHAGRWETSVMLALNEASVRMDRAIDFVPEGVNRAELTNRPISDFSPSGVWGHPSEASREEGMRLLEEMSDRLCAYVTGWLHA